MIAVDHLTTAVMDALSSGYCPTSKTVFLLRLVVAVAIFCCAGFGLIAAGSRSRGPESRFALRVCGAVAIVFALGAAAWDLFGLSGCGTHATAGLLWDWPW